MVLLHTLQVVETAAAAAAAAADGETDCLLRCWSGRFVRLSVCLSAWLTVGRSLSTGCFGGFNRSSFHGVSLRLAMSLLSASN